MQYNVKKIKEYKERRIGQKWWVKENAIEGNLKLRCGGAEGRVGLHQTDSTGNSGDAGVQPSIKCNLLLRGMFMSYVSDSQLAMWEFPVLINDFIDVLILSAVAYQLHAMCLQLWVNLSSCRVLQEKERAMAMPPNTHLLEELSGFN